MILILSDTSDPHADHVERKLQERGAQFFRFDPGQFPSNASMAFHYTPRGTSRSVVYAKNRRLDFGRVRSVWYRHPTPCIAHEEITDPLARDYIADERAIFTRDVLECMTPGRSIAFRWPSLLCPIKSVLFV